MSEEHTPSGNAPTRLGINELLAELPSEVLLEFTSQAAGMTYNPAASWISSILVRELARRRGEPLPVLQPLQLDDQARGFALDWLQFASTKYAECGVDAGVRGLVLLGALLDHVRRVIEVKAQQPLH